MCDCYTKCVDALLDAIPEAHGISGDRVIPNGQTYERFEYFLPNKRNKQKLIMAHTYCPYCGEPYDTQPLRGENDGE